MFNILFLFCEMSNTYQYSLVSDESLISNFVLHFTKEFLNQQPTHTCHFPFLMYCTVPFEVVVLTGGITIC